LTVIEHVREGETEAVSLAYEPALTGDVTDTRRTRAAADVGSAKLRAARIIATTVPLFI
jgi:hypothetical protein